MYAGEDGEVCVELGHVGKALSVSKASQPDKSKAGGWPVGDAAESSGPSLPPEVTRCITDNSSSGCGTLW